MNERLYAKRKGTGLGLYIARGIARVHGGDVVLESGIGNGIGNGCRFSLRLPTADAA